MTGFPAVADLRDTLRRLAEVEAIELPVLSVYLDMRPQATGQAPGRRGSEVVLRDRLREIERTYWPRGDDFDSFTADAERIRDYLESELDPSAQGLAIFACSGIGLWETVVAGVPFSDAVSVGPTADLFQLARLVDNHETAVVALVDSNTARLFVTRAGRLEEVEGLDEDSVSFRKRSMGGWSQARYQRHIDKHIADFARDTASAIEALVEREGARRLVIAGDEVAVTPLTDALPPSVHEHIDEVLRIDMRAAPDDLAEEVRHALAAAEAASGRSVADELIAAVRSGGLGVTDVKPTRRMLEIGAVEVLVMSELPVAPAEDSTAADARDLGEQLEAMAGDDGDTAGPDLDTRNELVRLASMTSAEVEVVADHPGLEKAGGVGALLRYRPG